MKTNIFIPKKIEVGFQNRDDTYTKKLAYVIYYDEKGKLKKEKSWNSWRDKKIESVTFENEPTSGFVLNKKVGGYRSGWDHRQTYVRIYDERNFEFEIDIPNLIYILENTNSIKGKGLEGEFVYGWNNGDLILMPTSSPDYFEIKEYNNIVHAKNYIKAKDLKIGATYIDKKNEEWIYMGRFDRYNTEPTDEYEYVNGDRSRKYKPVNKGKHHFFAQERESRWNSKSEKYLSLITTKSLSGRFIDVVSEECVENYADLFDLLETHTSYSPYDETKDEDEVEFEGTLEETYSEYNPSFKNKYLANGKLYQKGD